MLGSLLNHANEMNSIEFPSGNHSSLMETDTPHKVVSITPRSSTKAFVRISCNAGSMVQTREPAMDVEHVLHMNGGEGETSYAASSAPQVYSVSCRLCAKACLENFTIADMGCSSGPNNLVAISHIVDAMNAFC